MTEMRVYLAKLFWHFDLSLEPVSRHWVVGPHAIARFTRQKAPLMVTLKPAAHLLKSGGTMQSSSIDK